MCTYGATTSGSHHYIGPHGFMVCPVCYDRATVCVGGATVCGGGDTVCDGGATVSGGGPQFLKV